jgi:serine/alanine adding enzyme
MKIYTEVSEIKQEDWDELVVNSPTASFFQTRECYDFFASLSFMRPFIYGVSENDKLVGVVCGYIISEGSVVKSFLSRRAIICAGPMLDPAISEKALFALLQAAKNGLKNKVIYLESRNYNDYSIYKPVFEKVGFEYVEHLNFHVQTANEESALMQLNTTKRRDVKLTRKYGADWFETKSCSDLIEYYSLLKNLYRTRVKTPLYPFEFFEKLLQLPNGKLFVVKYEGKVIGGSVCVVLAGRIVYEWFVCGQDGRVKNIFPSTVATWSAIQYAAQHGISRFDMMGAGKPGDDYGVREFKSKFGGELVENGRFIIVFNKQLFEIGKFGINLYKNGFRKKKITAKPDIKYFIETNPLNIEKEAWVDFVYNHPNGNIFHSPEMYVVYLNTPKFSPVILIATNKTGSIVGCLLSVIQREYNGLLGELTTRSIVFGGPLAENNSAEIVDILLKKYNEIVKSKVIYSQYRNLSDTSGFDTAFKQNGYHFDEHLDILLDLTLSVEELEQNLHKERRRNIVKAEKEGLVFKQLTELEEINDVVTLLKKTYRRVKVPFSYEKLFTHSKNILAEKVNFFGAYFEGKMIAGQVRLCYKDTVYAWYSGSDSDYFNKKPNDFLLWNVLLWSKQNGYKTFDFGGAGKPNIPFGVRDYKLKFGGKLVEYGRYEITHKPFLMAIGEKAYKLYKRRMI